MAHNVTTTLYPSTYNCGMATSWSSNYSNFANYADSCAGYDGGERYARAMMFDSSSLSALRGKTIVSITLTINMDRFGNDVQLAISHKANNSSTSVTRGSAIQTFWASVCPTGVYADTDFTLTSGGIPTYGYVVGLASNTTTRGWVNCSIAHLTVVTSEPDAYTLAYNANGGSGAPESEMASSMDPSYTFTISSTIPTRDGYNFLGWSTDSEATTATYAPGDTLTVSNDGTTTLYAIWQVAEQTYIINLSLQGVVKHQSSFWPSNPAFNETTSYPDVGLNRNPSYFNGSTYVTEYYEYGTFLLGDMTNITGTPISIILSVTVSPNYDKRIAIGKKTNASSSDYEYSYLTLSPIVNTSNPSFTVDLTSYGLCPYGYVLWQNDQNATYAMNPVRIQSATLTIVTSSATNMYVLAYNVGDGSNAPSSQIGYGATSYSFTVSSVIPTRERHSFLGWSILPSAALVEYTANSTFIAQSTGLTVLYAVWLCDAYVHLVKADGGGLANYAVGIVDESSAKLNYYIPYVVNTAGTSLIEYSG